MENADFMQGVLANTSVFRGDKYLSVKNNEVKLQILTATYLIDEYLKRFDLREKDMIYLLTKEGKPYFKNHTNIKFSISHSNNIVGVAFSDREVGFDVQHVRSIGDEIYNRVLSDKEKEKVFSETNARERLKLFFKYWVMKEAILKRDGTGLISNMQDVYDDYGVVGILDASSSKNIVFENETYYYCANNGFNKELEINIL